MKGIINVVGTYALIYFDKFCSQESIWITIRNTVLNLHITLFDPGFNFTNLSTLNSFDVSLFFKSTYVI